MEWSNYPSPTHMGIDSRDLAQVILSVFKWCHLIQAIVRFQGQVMKEPIIWKQGQSFPSRMREETFCEKMLKKHYQLLELIKECDVTPSSIKPSTAGFAEPPRRKKRKSFCSRTGRISSSGKMWRTSFKNEASHSSSYPRAGTVWIREVEEAGCFGVHATSESLYGNIYIEFEVTTPGLPEDSETSFQETFERQVYSEEGKAQADGSFLTAASALNCS